MLWYTDYFNMVDQDLILYDFGGNGPLRSVPVCLLSACRSRLYLDVGFSVEPLSFDLRTSMDQRSGLRFSNGDEARSDPSVLRSLNRGFPPGMNPCDDVLLTGNARTRRGNESQRAVSQQHYSGVRTT